MTTAFRFRSEQILEIIRAEKRLRNPQTVAPDKPLPFNSYGE
jgi:hypothetical protein